MKTKHLNIYSWFGGIVVLFFFSCADLDEIPRNELTPNNFFNNESDALAAVTAAYSNLTVNTAFVHGVWWYGTDIGHQPNGFIGFDEYDAGLNADYSIVSYIWSVYFAGIHRANTALHGIPNINMDDDLKEELLAEARFLRAFFYYNLVELYGDVPLVTNAPGSLDEVLEVAVKTPRIQIYNELIIPDLEIAVRDLPAQSRLDASANKYAAAMLLTRAHMTLGQFPEANTAINEVIGQGNLGLAADYADLFKIKNEFAPVSGLDGGVVREDIFDINFSQDAGIGNAWIHWMGSSSITPSLEAPGGGWSLFLPTTDWVNMFESKDVRSDFIFSDSYSNDQGTTILEPGENLDLFNCSKYMDDSGNVPGNRGGMNIHLFRYADALLLKAEIENELVGPTNAYQYINDVRRRAGIDPLSGLSKEQMLDTIKIERARELGMEDMRRFDLTRWGDLVSTVRGLKDDRTATARNSIEDKHVRIPIPQNVIDASNGSIEQNPGY